MLGYQRGILFANISYDQWPFFSPRLLQGLQRRSHRHRASKPSAAAAEGVHEFHQHGSLDGNPAIVLIIVYQDISH